MPLALANSLARAPEDERRKCVERHKSSRIVPNVASNPNSGNCAPYLRDGLDVTIDIPMPMVHRPKFGRKLVAVKSNSSLVPRWLGIMNTMTDSALMN